MFGRTKRWIGTWRQGIRPSTQAGGRARPARSLAATAALLALLLSLGGSAPILARTGLDPSPQGAQIPVRSELACYDVAASVDPADGNMIGVYVRPEPNCGDGYLPGTTVYLEAWSQSGFIFDHWSGDLAGSTNPDSLSMDGDRTIVAHYRLTPDRLEPDDTWQQARLSLDAESRSIYPPGDVDWLKFQLEYESWVVIETSGPGAGDDTQLWLYDSQVNELEYNDNGGSGAFSRIERLCGDDALPPAFYPESYFYKVEEKGGDAAIDRYDITLRSGVCPDAYEPDNGWQEASEIESGAPQKHNIAPPGDEDWLTFDLEGRSAIRLETSGPDLTSDTRMWLYDAHRNELAFSDDINWEDGNLYSYIGRGCGAGEGALPVGT